MKQQALQTRMARAIRSEATGPRVNSMSGGKRSPLSRVMCTYTVMQYNVVAHSRGRMAALSFTCPPLVLPSPRVTCSISRRNDDAIVIAHGKACFVRQETSFMVASYIQDFMA